MNHVPYRTKIRAKVMQISDKIVEMSTWCRKFCQTKYFKVNMLYLNQKQTATQ